MYSRRTELKVVRRGESSGESVVGGEGVGAGGGFIVVVVDQKANFGYDFPLTISQQQFRRFRISNRLSGSTVGWGSLSSSEKRGWLRAEPN